MTLSNLTPRALAAVVLLACLIAPTGVRASEVEWTRERIIAAFDEVARNYGAIEYAIYTFMVEFGRAPYNLDELRETGHLNVLMTNPYSGGEVVSLAREDIPDGYLRGNIYIDDRDEGRESYLEAYFVRWGDPPMVRSMVKRIWLYQSQIDYDYFFGNDLPREEQMVAVYCRQAIDALESFRQRNGRSPEDFEDFYWNGDVNVHYVNPVSGELAVESEELSAGDFLYRKIGEEGYTLIGWGREQPVFFATTDEAEEMWFYEAFPEAAGEENELEDEGDCGEEFYVYF